MREKDECSTNLDEDDEYHNDDEDKEMMKMIFNEHPMGEFECNAL